jgi:hypothetical protein
MKLLHSLERKQIDIALLPVNGRDFFRDADGVVGNLNVRNKLRPRAAWRRDSNPRKISLDAGHRAPLGALHYPGVEAARIHHNGLLPTLRSVSWMLGPVGATG